MYSFDIIECDMEYANYIYSIGYSGYKDDLSSFLGELSKRQIDVLIDVRSVPYSKAFPEFDRECLNNTLLSCKIVYRNYAKEFGAKQLDADLYSDITNSNIKQIDYEIVRKSKIFRQGVDKVLQVLRSNHKIVFMCSEKDPLDCHRAMLICYAFNHDYNITARHIVPNKMDETQKELEERLKRTIQKQTLRKRHLNSLEQKLKRELELERHGQLFDKPDIRYLNDIRTYYRIINSLIGWKWEDVLGYT